YGVIFVKKYSREINAFWIVAIQNLIGGLFLLVTGSIFESWSEVVWNIPHLFGLVYGATIGIPASYIIYYSLINQGEASKIGSATFLVPILSVIISIIFLDETLTLRLLIGLVLVGISIYLVNYNKTKNKINRGVV